MDPAQVKWTEKEYSLQEYLTSFRDSFPNIIKVTEGFLGKQEIDSVSSSTVIRVNSLYNQQRVTAETKGGRLFSLPTKLTSLKFLVASSKDPAKSLTGPNIPLNLDIILSKYNLPVTILTSKALTYKQKGDTKSQHEMLSELTLKETYEEPFLLGHPIDKGKLFIEEPVTVPMYMTQLKLVVAVGFLNGNNIQWNKICDLMTKQVKTQGSFSNLILDEIFMLDKKSLSPQQPMYNTAEPIYIDINEINISRNKSIENNARGNMYAMPMVQQPKKAIMPPPKRPVTKIEPLKSKHFSTVNDIPNDLHNLTVEQVCECLKCLNMSQYVEAFEMTQVDGQLVYDLTKDMMQSCLGMNELNVLKFMKFRDGWRPNLQDQ